MREFVMRELPARLLKYPRDRYQLWFPEYEPPISLRNLDLGPKNTQKLSQSFNNSSTVLPSLLTKVPKL
jgi:hypothetical protein